jgi:hypothetical protein
MSNKITSTGANELQVETAGVNNIDAKEVELKQAVSKAGSGAALKVAAKEINGPKGLEPTRYGDWESKGRCYDF